MRRYLGLIITFGLAVLVLVALSLAGNVNLYREDETELEPARSSFNAGPTGTRAFYQLLEESGHRVSRWRQAFRDLDDKAPNGILVLIGPYSGQRGMTEEDTRSLHEWLQAGGRALVFSRYPSEQLGGLTPHAITPNKAYDKKIPDATKATVDQIITQPGADLLRQPTALTWGIKDLALSRYAARIPLHKNDEPEGKPAAGTSPETGAETGASPVPTATPAATPSAKEIEDVNKLFQNELYELPNPIVHLGDDEGAVLADYDYGKGRIIVLTDPFVIANHGLARGANLQLAQNLLRELGAADRPILFDEYHHGYRSETNALISYFSGTPFWWIVAQILLIVMLAIYSLGRRFARALPLPLADRHSPLEFVGSMASLQQAAEAYDLALENIYPKFKARLCRRLGLSVRAQAEEIADAVRFRPRYAPYTDRLVNVIHTSEQALKGAPLNDRQIVELVRAIRTLNTEMK